MKRHRLDPISFVAGLLFLVVALAFLDGRRTVIELAPMWLWGLPVLALGLTAILVGVGRWTRRADDPAGDESEAQDVAAAPSEDAAP